MPAAAMGLITLAAIAHATWNLATKRASKVGPVFIWMSSLISAILYSPLGILVLVTSQTPIHLWFATASVSGLIHAGYLLLLQRGYAIGDISVVYPLTRGTGPILSVVFAILLFSESPGIWGLAGAICIITGVVIISVSGIASGHRLQASIGIGIMTGAMIAGYTLWDAHAVTSLAVTPLALTWGSSVVEALTLAP